MKRMKVFLLVLFVGSSVLVHASPSPTRLQCYIRIWGFLKYYHPAITEGMVEADSLFLHHLDKINECNNTSEFRSAIAAMIATLEKVNPGTNQEVRDTASLFFKNDHTPDLFSNILLPKHIQAYLRTLRRTGVQTAKHVYMPENFHTTELPAEKYYKALQFPNIPFQLLALARYWNAIEYLFPYKYMLKRSWISVLREATPVFMKPLSLVGYEEGLMHLNAAIEDSHGGILSVKNSGDVYGRYFPPFTFRFVGDSIVVKDYVDTVACIQQHIQPGDVITEVRGRTVGQLMQDYQLYTSASNVTKQKTQLASLRLLLPFRGKDSVINISIVHNGKAVLQKLRLQIPDVKFRNDLTAIYQYENRNGTTQHDFVLRSIDPGVAWIDAANLSVLYNTSEEDHGIDSIMTLMRSHSKAILIDLRCYATQAVFFNKFLPALGRKLGNFASLRPHYNKFPGVYYDFDAYADVPAPALLDKYPGKVILLVNENTHSQSEWVSMMLQSSGPTITVGIQTSGADGDLIDLPMPGGYTLGFSGRHVAYPDGRPSQQLGVKIDRHVKITTQGVAGGRDEILEAAMKAVR